MTRARITIEIELPDDIAPGWQSTVKHLATEKLGNTSVLAGAPQAPVWTFPVIDTVELDELCNCCGLAEGHKMSCVVTKGERGATGPLSMLAEYAPVGGHNTLKQWEPFTEESL